MEILNCPEKFRWLASTENLISPLLSFVNITAWNFSSSVEVHTSRQLGCVTHFPYMC